ncbi:MAG: hypothetical protein KJ063_18290 [Anaerolineae bacterium]|nr:hypothetical protein [Anaerolineae bacterium]
MDTQQTQINEAMRLKLGSFLERLPEPVVLYIWGDETATLWEAEAYKLGRALAHEFPQIQLELRPRAPFSTYHPVIGVFQPETDSLQDHGIRIIGSPVGYQIMTLVAAIQAIAFRGSQLEGKARINAYRIPSEVTIQMFTAAEDEYGPAMSSILCNLAVISPHVQLEIIMADIFPDLAVRFDPAGFPHTVINKRVHIRGPLDEDRVMEQVAAALRPQ